MSTAKTSRRSWSELEGRPTAGDLRARLWKMDKFADQFIALPSGVWNKIDAQV